MIAYLNGKLAQKNPDSVVIDCHGVGYQAGISAQTYQQLPELGETVQLLTYHHFTDSDQRLFGFATSDEKELFELIITVKNVGPKLGLAILSGLQADRIRQALAQSDIGALSQISGIGKKTAERMVLELKDKIGDIETDKAMQANGAGGGNAKEAVSALESLGYRKKDAQQAVAKVADKEAGTVQELVKLALAQMGR